MHYAENSEFRFSRLRRHLKLLFGVKTVPVLKNSYVIALSWCAAAMSENVEYIIKKKVIATVSTCP